jgi:polysaccharide biosynthesis/export protein
MTDPDNIKITGKFLSGGHLPSRRLYLDFGAALVCTLVVILTGCTTPKPTPLTEKELTPYGSVKLREGDVVVLTFPGSPNLNTTQPVRRDGKIAPPLVAEVEAVGKTPAELEKEVLKLYEPVLVTKEVIVTVQSSAYPVFVTGAVLKPGKIVTDRPISALEAIMEAGGFNLARANMKGVVVIRQEAGQVQHYVLNLKPVLEGNSKSLFYLRPSDIIFVPERLF